MDVIIYYLFPDVYAEIVQFCSRHRLPYSYPLMLKMMMMMYCICKLS